MKRKTTRPRGFVGTWQPRGNRAHLLTDAMAVLADLKAEHLPPPSVRRILYILMGMDPARYSRPEPYDKGQYKELCEVVALGRRAGLIPMDEIDEWGVSESPETWWASVDELRDTVRHWCQDFQLDRQTGQSLRLACWCEAEGMHGQLRQECDPYSIRVYSSGRTDGLAVKHRLGRMIGLSGMPWVVLHVGDADADGWHTYLALRQDLKAFAKHYGTGRVTVTRLAANQGQIERWGLYREPYVPPERAANRRYYPFRWVTQAEAIHPRDMRRLLVRAIERRLDMEVYREVLEAERTAMAALERVTAALAA